MTLGPRIGERSTREAADAVGEVARDARSVGTAVVDHLPRVVTSVIAAAIGLVLALLLAKAVERALGRTRADHLAVVMLSRIVRLVGVIGALLVGLAIAGVAVGSVLAGLAVIGVAIGLAVQGTLETSRILVLRNTRRAGFAGQKLHCRDHHDGPEAVLQGRPGPQW
jgi:Na+/H+ antiporter NhaC